jgi:hypothetical protein
MTLPGDADIYDGVKQRLMPTAKLRHVVRRDWRARALRDGMTWQLRREIEAAVRTAEAPVLCTCPILAEAAEFAGAARIDRPAMRTAACGHGPMLLVTVAPPAIEPTLAALEEAMAAHANDTPVLPLVLHQFLGLFDRGDLPGFHAAIAAGVIEAIGARPDIATVILGESRMAPAATLLAGVAPRVLSIPEPGLRQSFGLDADTQPGAILAG